MTFSMDSRVRFTAASLESTVSTTSSVRSCTAFSRIRARSCSNPARFVVRSILSSRISGVPNGLGGPGGGGAGAGSLRGGSLSFGGGGTPHFFGGGGFGGMTLGSVGGGSPPSAPPPSILGPGSSAFLLASSLASASASSASNCLRLASISAAVGLGNSADGESGRSDMDTSRLSCVVSRSDTSTVSLGAGLSAHTSASWPAIPHSEQTAPSLPSGRRSLAPALPRIRGMRASNGCGRCCARFAAFSSSWAVRLGAEGWPAMVAKIDVPGALSFGQTICP